MDAFKVEIKGPDTVLIGSKVNFTANLYDGDKPAAIDEYTFIWEDNANPPHKKVRENIAFINILKYTLK